MFALKTLISQKEPKGKRNNRWLELRGDKGKRPSLNIYCFTEESRLVTLPSSPFLLSPPCSLLSPPLFPFFPFSSICIKHLSLLWAAWVPSLEGLLCGSLLITCLAIPMPMAKESPAAVPKQGKELSWSHSSQFLGQAIYCVLCLFWLRLFKCFLLGGSLRQDVQPLHIFTSPSLAEMWRASRSVETARSGVLKWDGQLGVYLGAPCRAACWETSPLRMSLLPSSLPSGKAAAWSHVSISFPGYIGD